MKGLKFIIAAAMVLVATVALAAEHAEGGHPGINWSDLIFRLINFAIFVAVIWKFAGKKVAELFRGRREQIETQLSDFTVRRQEAEARLKDVEASIANLEAERAKVLEEYKAQGESLKKAIIEKAEADAAKIVATAEATSAQERRSAEKRIRAEVAELVIDAAEKMLAEKLGQEEHEKLVDEYLTKVVLN